MLTGEVEDTRLYVWKEQPTGYSFVGQQAR